MAKLKTREEFIKDAMARHGDKYDYSKTNYINGGVKVKIICKIHGEFDQLPSLHLNHGCQKCGFDALRLPLDEFIKRSNILHNNKYNYSLVKYCKKISEKICIICPTHGEFFQRADSHLEGVGCFKCESDRRRNPVDDFINKSNKIHNNKYNYNKIDYNL